MKPLLHPAAQSQADALISRPEGTVLLHGEPHMGKTALAHYIAKQAVCLGCTDDSCASCKLVLASSHPDIIQLQPNEKGAIGIEDVQALQHTLTLANYYKGGKRVVIISDAHTASLPAQHALLKTLEEPPAGTAIIMTATSTQELLETIVSRCKLLFLPPLSQSVITQYLVTQRQLDEDTARSLAQMSLGAPGRALHLLSDEQAYEQAADVAERAGAFAGGKVFDRLRMIDGFIKDKELAIELARSLTHLVRHELKSSPGASTTHAAQAIQHFYSRLQANVSAKNAWDALAMELPC